MKLSNLKRISSRIEPVKSSEANQSTKANIIHVHVHSVHFEVLLDRTKHFTKKKHNNLSKISKKLECI